MPPTDLPLLASRRTPLLAGSEFWGPTLFMSTRLIMSPGDHEDEGLMGQFLVTA